MNYQAQVIQVLPGEDFTVYIWFSDGSVRLFDAKPILERGGVFSQISDKAIFEGTLTVMNHAVAWDLPGRRDSSKALDLDPVSTYEQSKPVEDPLLHLACKG